MLSQLAGVVSTAASATYQVLGCCPMLAHLLAGAGSDAIASIIAPIKVLIKHVPHRAMLSLLSLCVSVSDRCLAKALSFLQSITTQTQMLLRVEVTGMLLQIIATSAFVFFLIIAETVVMQHPATTFALAVI